MKSLLLDISVAISKGFGRGGGGTLSVVTYGLYASCLAPKQELEGLFPGCSLYIPLFKSKEQKVAFINVSLNYFWYSAFLTR